MKLSELKSTVGTALLLAALTALAGCRSNNDTANTPPAPEATPITTPTPDAARNEYAPLTLPVLDAFFTDEQFATDVKRELSLTDEQVAQLRATARQETARLREDAESSDYAGSTAEARRLAEERVGAILGTEKAGQLAAYVGRRWSGSVAMSEGVGADAAGLDPRTSPSASPVSTPLMLPGVSPTEVPLASPSLNAKLEPPTVAKSGAKPGRDVVPAPGVTPSATARSRALNTRINVEPSDTRIVVNAPAYRMDLFRAGQLVKSYRIGIGYPEFPLPTGQRAARSIIFNPTWTPPDEPWVESPGGKVKVGEKVEAGDKRNPLGPIKIPIGLPSLIHGGKSPARLGGFNSHGCVGLTNEQVRDFARRLAEVGGTPLTLEQIAEYAKTPTETKNVKLAANVPVELRYETIVVEDGKLHIYRDVYERGTNTEANLSAVLQAWGLSLSDLTEPERAQVEKALKQMALDPSGRSAVEGAPTPTPTKTDAKTANGRVPITRTVKGAKEATIEIAALAGKGYPAPMDLDTGGQKAGATQRKPARKAAK